MDFYSSMEFFLILLVFIYNFTWTCFVFFFFSQSLCFFLQLLLINLILYIIVSNFWYLWLAELTNKSQKKETRYSYQLVLNLIENPEITMWKEIKRAKMSISMPTSCFRYKCNSSEKIRVRISQNQKHQL